MEDNFFKYYSRKIEESGGIKPFIDRKRKNSTGAMAKFLLDELHPGEKVIEIGAGTGSLSYLLDEGGLQVTAADINNGMISIMKSFSQTSKNKFKVIKLDIKEIDSVKDTFSVSTSIGLMEHFNKEEIPKLIDRQLKVANRVVFAVPSNQLRKKFKEQSMGDELFLNYNEWLKLLNSDSSKVIDSFGLLFGKSSNMRLPKFIFNNNFLSRKFARFASFYCFVVEKNL